jgi:hypothetical protein
MRKYDLTFTTALVLALMTSACSRTDDNGHAAGMGIREDGLITGNTARFVPHVIES